MGNPAILEHNGAMAKILVVEDAKDIQRLLATALREHELVFGTTISEGRELLRAITPELVLLDLSLPDGDGLLLCSEIQNDDLLSAIPVIILTGRNTSSEKVTGLTLGADDYITKPFDPGELRARVSLRLKKATRQQKQANAFALGGLHFDLAKQVLTIDQAGTSKQVELTRTEFKLLLYFAKHEDHVLSREQLLSSVWGAEVNLVDRVVDGHVSTLRKVLKPTAYTITAVYGEGYRFCKQKQDKIEA